MADTIITNTPDRGGDSAAGWVVALIVLAAVIVGGIYVYRHGIPSRAAPQGGTNINVSVPLPGSNSGDTGGTNAQ